MLKIHIKNVAVYLFSSALSVLLIWYILYHLFSGSDNEIETSPAMIVTKSNTVSLEGYIVRDETIINANVEGGVNYLFGDGDKVQSGAVIANIYSGEGVEELSDRILAIDKKISVLENSSVSDKATKTDSKVIDDKINELFYLMRDGIENGDTEYAIYRKDELLTYLNKRQVLTQNISGFEEQIVSLIREKETLSGQLINLEENVAVSNPGYFYSQVDGYESVFDVSKLENLTLQSYEELVNSQSVDYSSALVVGKIVESDQWYILSETVRDDLKKFNEGKVYKIKFPFNSDVSIEMTLEKIVLENESEKAVLVFKSNYMPTGFKYLRKQNIQVVEESYTGYKISANAVRVVDGVRGVYILSGNTVSFKEIDVLTETDGYFIVKEQPTYLEDEFYYKKLGLYDNVIISGKNLYDGKIISAAGVNQ